LQIFLVIDSKQGRPMACMPYRAYGD